MKPLLMACRLVFVVSLRTVSCIVCVPTLPAYLVHLQRKLFWRLGLFVCPWSQVKFDRSPLALGLMCTCGMCSHFMWSPDRGNAWLTCVCNIRNIISLTCKVLPGNSQKALCSFKGSSCFVCWHAGLQSPFPQVFSAHTSQDGLRKSNTSSHHLYHVTGRLFQSTMTYDKQSLPSVQIQMRSKPCLASKMKQVQMCSGQCGNRQQFLPQRSVTRI